MLSANTQDDLISNINISTAAKAFLLPIHFLSLRLRSFESFYNVTSTGILACVNTDNESELLPSLYRVNRQDFRVTLSFLRESTFLYPGFNWKYRKCQR